MGEVHKSARNITGRAPVQLSEVAGSEKTGNANSTCATTTKWPAVRRLGGKG